MKADMVKKGQSFGEVSILLALVTAVFIGMRTYLQRGLQARHKEFVDVAVTKTQNAAGGPGSLFQYEPYYRSRQDTAWAKSAQREYLRENEETRKFGLESYARQKVKSLSSESADFMIDETLGGGSSDGSEDADAGGESGSN